jgi:hypothetical protein
MEAALACDITHQRPHTIGHSPLQPINLSCTLRPMQPHAHQLYRPINISIHRNFSYICNILSDAYMHACNGD